MQTEITAILLIPVHKEREILTLRQLTMEIIRVIEVELLHVAIEMMLVTQLAIPIVVVIATIIHARDVTMVTVEETVPIQAVETVAQILVQIVLGTGRIIILIHLIITHLLGVAIVVRLRHLHGVVHRVALQVRQVAVVHRVAAEAVAQEDQDKINKTLTPQIPSNSNFEGIFSFNSRGIIILVVIFAKELSTFFMIILAKNANIITQKRLPK